MVQESTTGSTVGGIEHVGVVGGGLMGAGICEVVARAGVRVTCLEISAAAAESASGRIRASLQRGLDRGKITAEELEAAVGLIEVVDDLALLADCDLVVEAASEDLAIKLDLFARLGQVLTKPDAVLASNTSSVPIAKLAAASGRPEQVVGVHFFNPVPVMRLVELIPSLTTSPDALERVRLFVTDRLGKESIEATDRSGFVVNALLVPYLMSAIRMREAGYASAEDIDRGMVLGCGHPMGPLALCDMIGLDTIHSIGLSMYEEYRQAEHAPPPLLTRMVEAGMTGRKSGRGFYDYS